MDIELVLHHFVWSSLMRIYLLEPSAGREICRYRSQDLVLSLISTSARIPCPHGRLKI